jgi:prepilin-type processing-associated H-X9-DG protein
MKLLNTLKFFLSKFRIHFLSSKEINVTQEIKTTLPSFVLKDNMSSYFFETGTADGDAVRLALECGFEKIFTVEIDPVLYAKNILKYKKYIDEGRVFMFLGDTFELMPGIISNYIDKTCTFWLDAHQDFGPGGVKKCPLIEELEYIKSSPLEHKLLIDDRRMFGIWWGEGINEELIVSKIKELNPNYNISYADGHIADDIIVAKI